MTRDENLAEADLALRPIQEIMAKARLGIAENVNLVAVQLAVEYAKVRALMALAQSAGAGGSVAASVAAGAGGSVADGAAGPAASVPPSSRRRPPAQPGLIVPQG